MRDDGTYLLGNRVMELPDLQQQLIAAVKKSDQQKVLVRGDQHALHGMVAAAIGPLLAVGAPSLLAEAGIGISGTHSPVDPDPPGALGVNPDVIPGEERDLVVGSFSKDGIFYAYDRSDGTFIYARPTGYQNVIESYDGRTGAYRTNPEAMMTGDLDREATVCKDSRMVPQGAYSPLSNAYYIGAWNGSCSVIRARSTPARPSSRLPKAVGRCWSRGCCRC